jgi:hypothetical protein
VRVGGNAFAAGFLAEIADLIVGNAAFNISACIDAGRGVALKIDQIPTVLIACSLKEMIEADFIQCGGRLVTGDMATDTGGFFVGAHYTSHGVPANQALDAVFHGHVTGMLFLQVGGDGVHIRCRGVVGQVSAGATGFVDESLKQVMRAFNTFFFDHGGKGIKPLACFLWVVIGLLRGQVRRQGVRHEWSSPK